MTSRISKIALWAVIAVCLNSEFARADPEHTRVLPPLVPPRPVPLVFGSPLQFGTASYDRYFNDPALTSVTREFGNTIINMKQLPFRSDVAEAFHKPWSSWWYPKKEDFLFKDLNSPLNKYDLFRRARYRNLGRQIPKSAAEFERESYNPRSLSWEGLCDAWSLAAISMPEPRRPITIQIGNEKIYFSVADLKALLLKTFEAVDDNDLKYYGQKFNGGPEGWIFPDIFPNEFHRFLEVFLFERKQSFVMDHDPGPEIWNVPVYKTNYQISAIPSDPFAVFVDAWVYSAEVVGPHNKDAVGTREAIRTYHYILRGQKNANGDLVVRSGDWAVGADRIDSRKNHPDFITTIKNPVTMIRKSFNPEIETQLVDEILLKSY